MIFEFCCIVWFYFICSVWLVILGVFFYVVSWYGEIIVIMNLSCYVIIFMMKLRCMWF